MMSNRVLNILEPLIFVSIGIVSPTLLYVLSFAGVLISKKKYGLYLVLFIVAHVFLAYNWIPWNDSFDLVRHHQTVLGIKQMDTTEILSNIFNLFAPLSFFISYLVSIFGNKDVLQAVVTL